MSERILFECFCFCVHDLQEWDILPQRAIVRAVFDWNEQQRGGLFLLRRFVLCRWLLLDERRFFVFYVSKRVLLLGRLVL